MRSFVSLCALTAVLLAAAPVSAAQSGVQSLFLQARDMEAALRREIDDRPPGSDPAALLERARTLAQTYEDLARLFPGSDYGDDALWQGAILAADTFWEFAQAADRARALDLFGTLEAEYEESPFVPQIAGETIRLTTGPGPIRAQAAVAARAPTPAPVSAPAPPPAAAPRAVALPGPPDPRPAARGPVLTAIRREVLPKALRITLEIGREVPFFDRLLEEPSRVLIDLRGTDVARRLENAALYFPEDVVRRIRVGQPRPDRTRVAIDLEGAAGHSVYALYDPYRIVIDVERRASARRSAAPTPSAVSLSRQLGLGISRIVIDPGHGGHDPGAQVRGLSEAELTLDIALRLEKRLLAQPGVDVVLTRRRDVYVPLDERTGIANRTGADLFLSIHANANADASVSGVETYVLNFASSAAAEAVAARENAGSSRSMGELAEMVQAIALNDRIDESHDFAAFVQAALYDTLRGVNRRMRNLGVKEAPFVVLLGAGMPSVLAEISFLTNRDEAALLRTPKYRDRIAEALFTGVMRYQGTLNATLSALDGS